MPATDPMQVKFYSRPPKHYQTLGRINLSMHEHESQEYTQDMSVLYAKQLATTVGGNAIIIKEAGFTTDQNTGLASFIFQGAVIHEY